VSDALWVGVIVGALLLVILTTVFSLSSAIFNARVSGEGARYWVRADAGFQQWLKRITGRSIGYGRQMLMVLRAEGIELYTPHRIEPVWTTSYKDIVRIGTEAFRSRSVPNTRAVRIEFDNYGSIAVRPELLWIPARFSPAALVDELARDLAERAQRAESARSRE
jgi:hypothetical protein